MEDAVFQRIRTRVKAEISPPKQAKVLFRSASTPWSKKQYQDLASMFGVTVQELEASVLSMIEMAKEWTPDELLAMTELVRKPAPAAIPVPLSSEEPEDEPEEEPEEEPQEEPEEEPAAVAEALEDDEVLRLVDKLRETIIKKKVTHIMN
jgi:ribosomal protein L12E/L44/L45/RPP1/RPP2